MLALSFITSFHSSLFPPFSWGIRGSNGHPTVATGSLLDAVLRKIGNVTSIFLGLIMRLSSVGMLALICAEPGCRMHMGFIWILLGGMSRVAVCYLDPILDCCL